MGVGLKKFRRRTVHFFRAWGSEIASIFDQNRLFDAALALVITYIGLEGKQLPQVIEEANSYVIFFQAFTYVGLVWLLYGLLKAPFKVRSEERLAGSFSGSGTFIYNEPKLVKVLHYKEGGETEQFSIEFEDAEPSSYVKYAVELDPPIYGKALIMMATAVAPAYGQIGKTNGRGGVLLPKNKRATLVLGTEEPIDTLTARVYCRSFEIR